LNELSAGGGTGLLSAPVPGQAGSPRASAMFPTRLLLPTFKYAEKSIFESPSYNNMPVKLDPVNENDERCIMEQFVQKKVTFRIKFLGEFKAICETALARNQGPSRRGWGIVDKIKGRKSCDTVPLISSKNILWK
jgi:hypothetical protein